KLVAQASHAARAAAGNEAARLVWQERTVELPLGELPSRDELLTRLEEYESKIKSLEGRTDGSVNSWLALKSWAEGCLAEIDGKASGRPSRARIQAAALG